MREHDPGTTAAPGDAAGRAAPNGNAGTGFGARDGAGTAGRASCRVADLIAEARRRNAGHTFTAAEFAGSVTTMRYGALLLAIADEVERLQAERDVLCARMDRVCEILAKTPRHAPMMAQAIAYEHVYNAVSPATPTPAAPVAVDR